MNLSCGERPVCLPVRTTSGPSAAITPSPARTASSYSSAVERFARTMRPMDAAPSARRVSSVAGTGGGLGHRLDSSARRRSLSDRPAARGSCSWRRGARPRGSRLPQSLLARHRTATRAATCPQPGGPGRCIRMSGRQASRFRQVGRASSRHRGPRDRFSPLAGSRVLARRRGTGRDASPRRARSRRSAIRSSTFSIPTDRRTSAGSTSRCEPATEAWVIVAGISTSDSTPPSDSARVKSRVDSAIATRALRGGRAVRAHGG